ncbi:hypothetical protein AB1L42_00430 [Thalassoglobus sp. JC818]|uniref:hypothetical protein n=1 Tax=Thalassoglobus sp. JC818 TaxID=3232136 RepID=UPI0034584448
MLIKRKRMLMLLGLVFSLWTAGLARSLSAKQDSPLTGRSSAESVCINIRLIEAGRLEKSPKPCGTKIVYFEGYGPADELAEWLSTRKEIEELNLICICFVESDIQAILNLPNLAHLNLRGCRLTSDQLNRLKSHRSNPTIELNSIVLISE